MANPSTDYHDYVFRDGKLVGEFEEMYRRSSTTPWHQDEQGNWIDVRITKEMLSDIGPFDEIHDMGCGLGNYLSLMKERVGTTACRCFGYDISETACAKARQQFPGFQFTKLDLTLASGPAKNESPPGNQRLFMIRGTLWYVFPQLNAVIKTLSGFVKKQDTLLVVQNFPPLSEPFIGKEVIPNHKALIDHFSSKFRPIRHAWYEDTLKAVNDNWFIGIFSVKDN